MSNYLIAAFKLNISVRGTSNFFGHTHTVTHAYISIYANTSKYILPGIINSLTLLQDLSIIPI
jgi:hypothetical protein